MGLVNLVVAAALLITVGFSHNHPGKPEKGRKSCASIKTQKPCKRNGCRWKAQQNKCMFDSKAKPVYKLPSGVDEKDKDQYFGEDGKPNQKYYNALKANAAKDLVLYTPKAKQEYVPVWELPTRQNHKDCSETCNYKTPFRASKGAKMCTDADGGDAMYCAEDVDQWHVHDETEYYSYLPAYNDGLMTVTEAKKFEGLRARREASAARNPWTNVPLPQEPKDVRRMMAVAWTQGCFGNPTEKQASCSPVGSCNGNPSVSLHSGDYLDQISFTYPSGTIVSGGGGGGQGWNEVATTCVVGAVIYHGAWVNSIQFIGPYISTTRYGGTGGGPTLMMGGDNMCLGPVSLSWGSYINQICLTFVAQGKKKC